MSKAPPPPPKVAPPPPPKKSGTIRETWTPVSFLKEGQRHRGYINPARPPQFVDAAYLAAFNESHPHFELKLGPYYSVCPAIGTPFGFSVVWGGDVEAKGERLFDPSSATPKKKSKAPPPPIKGPTLKGKAPPPPKKRPKKLPPPPPRG